MKNSNGENIDPDSPPITGYRLMHSLPCMADYELVRVIFLIEGNLAPLIPYLNALKVGAIFNPNTYTLTVKEQDVMWTFQPDRVTLAKVSDETEAERRMAVFVAEVCEIWGRRSEIEPCYERRAALPAIEVFKLLPRTNCGKCDVPTCMAFAVKIVAGHADLSACGPMFTPDYSDIRERIIELLKDAGYNTGTLA